MKIIFIVTLLMYFLTACNTSTQMGVHEDTSTIYIRINTSRYTLTNCSALQRGDSLKVNFTGNDWYELSITKKNNNFDCDLHQLWSITNRSYVMPIYKSIIQHISLDKEKYKTDDNLKGKVLLNIAAFHSCPEKYVDMIKVKGWFETVVK